MARCSHRLRQTRIEAGGGNPFGYLLYLPPDYARTATCQRWPLLLFLHGAGERGDDPAEVARHGPPKLVEQGHEFPFIVVSPQCPTGGYWKPEPLTRLLDQVEATHAVDRERIYVTGLSMGGFGTWALLAHSPYRFAAAAIVCGGGNPAQAMRVRHLPIWLFHGRQDNIVPIAQSQLVVGALQVVGGNVRFTVYPDADHDSWTATYNNPEIYQWLLRHERIPGPGEV